MLDDKKQKAILRESDNTVRLLLTAYPHLSPESILLLAHGALATLASRVVEQYDNSGDVGEGLYVVLKHMSDALTVTVGVATAKLGPEDAGTVTSRATGGPVIFKSGE